MDFKNSAFFGTKSIHVLCRLLLVERSDLERLLTNPVRNYKQFSRNGRWIETPNTPIFKRIHRRIHDLLSRIPAPDYMFSTYRGRGAVKNAEMHDGSVAMVKLDIRSFFPSTEGRRVYTLFLEEFGCAEDIATIMWKLCTISKTKNNQRSHLPTGAAASPILSFLIYEKMFSELAAQAERMDLVMTVYADDITFSGSKATQAALNEATRIIEKYGLRQHWRKQKVWGKHHNHKVVTGVQVTGKGQRLQFSQKQKIESFRNSLDGEKCPKKRAKIYQRLCGTLESAGQIESKYKRVSKYFYRQWRNEKGAWNAHLNMSRGTSFD